MSNALARLLLHVSGEAILVHDGQAIIDANTSSAVLLAEGLTELRGKPLSDFFNPSDLSGLLAAEEAEQQSGRTLPVQASDGTVTPRRIRSAGLSGERVLILGRTECDAFAHERAGDAPLSAKEDAALANRTKTQFLAKLSHALRTPLNAILGFSEVMAEEAFGPLGDEKYREYIQDIHASGQHVMGLINDILDLTRIEVGALPLEDEDVDLAQVLETCGRLVLPSAYAAKLTLSVSTEDGLPKLRADGRRVRQIVINLLSNAIKFTPAEGAITVRAFRNDHGVRLAVTDTGVGIAADDLAKIFQRDDSAEADLESRAKASGMGLPLSKALAEMMGGSLHIDSKPDHGTTVTLLFPESCLI